MALRPLLLALFLFGAVGACLELVFLEHWEEAWQWAPVILLVASLPFAASLALRPTAPTVYLFRALMVLFVGAGAIGIIQHVRGNVEFELEMYPSMRGFDLIWESLRGATPSLAPGSMTVLGFLGIIYTLRHPALSTGRISADSNKDREA